MSLSYNALNVYCGTRTNKVLRVSLGLVIYRGTYVSKVLRVSLRLVEVRVSMKRWSGHLRLSKIYIFV
jgi:hypothetical protein